MRSLKFNHGYWELDIIPMRFNIFSLAMSDFRQSRIAGAILVFAVLLLSGNFAAYRHFSTGAAKYITYDHALRRVLGRAERDNLRRGLIVKDQSPERVQQIGEVPPSSEIAAAYYRTSFVEHLLIDPNRSVHTLSSVLNL